MTDKPDSKTETKTETKKKRLPKSQRKHIRRTKAEERKNAPLINK